jgi:hypothetical protein
MKPGVPWNTNDLQFDALEAAREAEGRSDRFATRPGTVGAADVPPRRRYETVEGSEWGRQLYPRRYPNEESRYWEPGQRHSLARSEAGRGEERQPRTDIIGDVNRRLDGLTRQLDHLARLNSVTGSSLQRRSAQDDEGLHRLAAAIARLDQRLEQMIAEGRRAISDIERRVSAFDRTLGGLRHEGHEQAAGELSSYPRPQESEAATPSMSRLPEAPHYTGASDGQQLSGLQKQIEQLASRMDGAAFPSDRSTDRADTARRVTPQQELMRQRVAGFGGLDALRR